jgi:hypothetical protein
MLLPITALQQIIASGFGVVLTALFMTLDTNEIADRILTKYFVYSYSGFSFASIILKQMK